MRARISTAIALACLLISTGPLHARTYKGASAKTAASSSGIEIWAPQQNASLKINVTVRVKVRCQGCTPERVDVLNQDNIVVGEITGFHMASEYSSQIYVHNWDPTAKGDFKLVAVANNGDRSYPVNVHVGSRVCYPPGTGLYIMNPYDDPIPAGQALYRMKGALHVHWVDDEPYRYIKPRWIPIRPYYFPGYYHYVGQYSAKPAQVAQEYRDLDYDFIAMSEHNFLTPPRCNTKLDSNFVWIENCQEVSAWGKYTHILALGVNGVERPGKDVGEPKPYPEPQNQIAPPLYKYKGWSTDDYHFVRSYDLANGCHGYEVQDYAGKPLTNSQRSINNIETMNGIAFIPHPGAQGKEGFSDSDLNTLTKYQAMAIWTGATAPLVVPGLRGIYEDGWLRRVSWGNHHLPQNRWLMSGYSEEDYTPGHASVNGAIGKSSWMLLDMYRNNDTWKAGDNFDRSEMIKETIRHQRWWSYINRNGLPWTKAYPELQVSVQNNTAQDTVTVTVKSTNSATHKDMPIKISLWGETRDNHGYRRIITAYRGSTYTKTWDICEAPVWFVVMGEYWSLTVYSNPIRVIGGAWPAVPFAASALSSSSSSSNIQIAGLSPDQCPNAVPGMGNIGQVYEITTSDGQSPNTPLTLPYAGYDVERYNTANLRIFRWNSSANSWQALESTLDASEEQVTANIPSTGKYTISAVDPNDTQAPVAFWLPLSDQSSIQGTVDVAINATDNTGVESVIFYLNDVEVANDYSATDGEWSAEIDFSHYVAGTYELKAVVRDLAGNATSISRDITISSSTAVPQTSVNAPVYDPATDKVMLTGSITSITGDIAWIYLDLDDQPLALCDGQPVPITAVEIPTSSGWSISIGSALFSPGKHTMKIIVQDQYGNRGVTNLPEISMPLSAINVYADPYSAQVVGKGVQLAAVATGGENVEYKFEVIYNSVCTTLCDYSPEVSYAWTPMATGRYTLRISAREAGTSSALTCERSYVVTEPMSGVILTANPLSPVSVGSDVRLVAQPIGGSNVEYMFEVYDGASWSKLRDFVEGNSYNWTPNLAKSYKFRVSAREVGTSDVFTSTLNITAQ